LTLPHKWFTLKEMALPIEPFYDELGRRISAIRHQRGMTQDRLGSLLIPPSTRASIANIENGKQRVLVHTLLQLAEALQVEVMELLGTAPTTEVKSAAVSKELKSKLGLPPKQLHKLRRELGLTEKDE